MYKATLDGEVLYIGSGAKGREKHCNNGVSHVYGLNELHFKGVEVQVTIVKGLMSKQDSLELEKQLIVSLNPRWNVVHKTSEKMQKMAMLSRVSSHINKILTESMKEHLGRPSFCRYKNSTKSFIKLLGVNNLVDGCKLPSVCESKVLLLRPEDRGLFARVSHKNTSDVMENWLREVFDYSKEGARVTLKVKKEIVELCS